MTFKEAFDYGFYLTVDEYGVGLRGNLNKLQNIESLIIPDNIEGLPVTQCGGFYELKKLKNVRFPKCVTTIDSSTFAECKSLKTVILPENLEEVFTYTFKNCANLESITIPNSVREIDTRAFLNCTGLKSVTFSGTTTVYKDTFINCTRLEHITIMR